jgi:hypothetical protein
MAYHHWHGDGLLRPRIPFEDVKVGPTNALQSLNQHVINADEGTGTSLRQCRF